jgi:hypothetical protein
MFLCPRHDGQAWMGLHTYSTNPISRAWAGSCETLSPNVEAQGWDLSEPNLETTSLCTRVANGNGAFLWKTTGCSRNRAVVCEFHLGLFR